MQSYDVLDFGQMSFAEKKRMLIKNLHSSEIRRQIIQKIQQLREPKDDDSDQDYSPDSFDYLRSLGIERRGFLWPEHAEQFQDEQRPSELISVRQKSIESLRVASDKDSSSSNSDRTPKDIADKEVSLSKIDE